MLRLLRIDCFEFACLEKLQHLRLERVLSVLPPSPLDQVLMYPPAAALPNIGFDCANEEIFTSLEKIAHGCRPPPNVIPDVNPYSYPPSKLPADADGIWFLFHTKENESTKFGFWKVKGEACKLFSNSSITGWRTTREFFEGQVPYECKTDWMMQEYWITDERRLGENSKLKEAKSLFRVFLGGEQGVAHQKQQKLSGLHIASEILIHSTQPVVSIVQNVTDSSSAIKPAEEKDDERWNFALTGEPANYPVEMPSDIFSRGDYLELLDLDEPASRSSSSDNSSCLTMSSDECFDSLALLKELDSEINQDSVQKDANCRFNTSTSFTPNEVVMAPSSPGTFISIRVPTEVVGMDSSLPRPAAGHKDLDDAALQNTVRKQKVDHRDAGPSSSNDEGTSSSLQLRSEKATKGRKKKLKNKYLCFMSLYFLF